MDYDSAKSVSDNEIKNRIMRCGLWIVRFEKKRSPGGKGWHVAVRVNAILNRWQCLTLQCLCESDPKREAIGFQRALILSEKRWHRFNILFDWSKKETRR